MASSRPLLARACLGPETLQGAEVSSVALEGNPARMRPTKTHSAPPVGASDQQPLQIPPTCLGTVGPRPSEGSLARPSGSRRRPALSALEEGVWRHKASGFLRQIKQVASVLLQCLAALLLLGDPLGLEGCQHSVQPQPLQALWARREAKCSERAPQPPAREDSGSGAAAAPHPSAPLPVRTHPLLGRCHSRAPASGPRAAGSLVSGPTQERSALEPLTHLCRALAAGEAEPLSGFPVSGPPAAPADLSPVDTGVGVSGLCHQSTPLGGRCRDRSRDAWPVFWPVPPRVSGGFPAIKPSASSRSHRLWVCSCQERGTLSCAGDPVRPRGGC